MDKAHEINAEGMRVFDEADARGCAASFDLTELPAGFVVDPYPAYHALRTYEPVREMPVGSLFPTAIASI